MNDPSGEVSTTKRSTLTWALMENKQKTYNKRREDNLKDVRFRNSLNVSKKKKKANKWFL
jgi:hypothetical protein